MSRVLCMLVDLDERVNYNGTANRNVAVARKLNDSISSEAIVILAVPISIRYRAP